MPSPTARPALSEVRLYRMDLPEQPCPWGLKTIRLLQEHGIPFADHRLTSPAAIEAFKAEQGVASTPQIFAGAERIGGYTDLATRLGVRPEGASVSYTPVLAVFGTALLVSLAVGGGLRGFMGYALCLLAMLKLMDVEAFASSFLKYDLISQRLPLYAQLYPGLELLAGLGFLITPPVPLAALLALLLGLAGMVSVTKAVYIDKLALNCACVGGNSSTPLGVVSFAENLIMVAMGAAVLVAGSGRAIGPRARSVLGSSGALGAAAELPAAGQGIEFSPDRVQGADALLNQGRVAHQRCPEVVAGAKTRAPGVEDALNVSKADVQRAQLFDQIQLLQGLGVEQPIPRLRSLGGLNQSLVAVVANGLHRQLAQAGRFADPELHHTTSAKLNTTSPPEPCRAWAGQAGGAARRSCRAASFWRYSRASASMKMPARAS